MTQQGKTLSGAFEKAHCRLASPKTFKRKGKEFVRTMYTRFMRRYSYRVIMLFYAPYRIYKNPCFISHRVCPEASPNKMSFGGNGTMTGKHFKSSTLVRQKITLKGGIL